MHILASSLVVFLSLTSFAFAGKSPFKSCVPGLTIPNANIVTQTENGTILRGKAPGRKLRELVGEDGAGVTDFLIFKKQVRKEVDRQVNALQDDFGISPKRITHIPFKWRGFENFREACEQLVEGLQKMRNIAYPRYSRKTPRTMFVHCTAGEDRTGTLSGLFKMLEGRHNVRTAFEEELCHHGYGAGNPNKPRKRVVGPIHRDLTPVYLKMAYFIENDFLTMERLRKSVCKVDPAWTRGKKKDLHKKYRTSDRYRLSKYKCSVSSRAYKECVK